ncbi:MAG TPA: hypothetical protein PKC03_11645 [Dokdonella sp.]|jgi:hypothetical protein|nr:hypothetical protein [Dokdonella sp.]
MNIRNLALAGLATLLVSACGSGPVKRISPPTASVQELGVRADGSWRLLVRVQNFSNVSMTFSAINARFEVAGVDVGAVSLQIGLDIPGASAEVFEATLKPAAGQRPGPGDFAYRLHGTIESSEPKGEFKFERSSRLSPVPGLPDTWR